MNGRGYVIAMAIGGTASLLSIIVRSATWGCGPREVFLLLVTSLLFVIAAIAVATGIRKFRQQQPTK